MDSTARAFQNELHALGNREPSIHKGSYANRKAQIFRAAAVTGKERPLCDCPEPCGCYAEGYAAGKDKAFFEMEMAERIGPAD